jgi:DNA-binding XRE family transcriptional regulator
MGLQQEIERLSNAAALTAITHDLLAVAHKLRYPMAAILAKVPGDTLAERARKCGVSRQTMYVWAQERFRPRGEQAEIIAKLTGVPVAQICELSEGFYNDDGVGEADRPPSPRLAKAGRKLPSGAARLRAKRKGLELEQGKRGHNRKALRRAARRPDGGKGG